MNDTKDYQGVTFKHIYTEDENEYAYICDECKTKYFSNDPNCEESEPFGVFDIPCGVQGCTNVSNNCLEFKEVN